VGKGIIKILLISIVFILINVIAHQFYAHIDLTEDSRFSLTTPTKELLKKVKEPIYVKVLLDGEFPAGFTRLQQSTNDLLARYKSYFPQLIYQFQNPSEGTVEQINSIREELRKDGMFPTTLRYGEGDALTNKQIYPYAIFSLGSKQVVVNLLEEQVMGVPEEVVLNNAVSLLEYKFSNAIQKLTLLDKANIVLTEGNGELAKEQTARFESLLREHYNTGRINLDSTYQINPNIDIVIIAKPQQAFNQKEQFVLDQYIMSGGKVIWLIDRLDVNVDSIGRNELYIPSTIESGFEDAWFKYGFRIQPNLVLDLQSSTIPQIVGMAGGEPQINMIKWPYHVLSFPQTNHPIAKNLDRVNLFFPSTIDTILTNSNIQKTILLKSSEYTRYQLTPVRLNFQILQEDFKAELFNKEPQNVAILLEGEFESAFKNRVGHDLEEVLQQIGAPFKDISPPTKQLVISDGDIINNVLNIKEKQIFPLGYNKWERKVYNGNEPFMLNAIEYLLDDSNILAARSKEVRLRLLDTVKARQEKMKWRLINIGLPILGLLLFGFGFNYLRKRKYTR